MGIGICRNKDCSIKHDCLRYVSSDGDIYLFENICNEENNHKWFWIIRQASTPTTDIPVNSTPTNNEKGE